MIINVLLKNSTNLRKYTTIFTPFDARLNYLQSLLIYSVFILAFLLLKSWIKVDGEKF
jgi:hypothetical protein